MAGSAKIQVLPPSPEKCLAYIELAISLSLFSWPALSLAVQNNWGGPNSSDKRDCLAGAIVELFDDRPDTDMEDLETILLQYVFDEFEVNIDDESGFEVAEQVMRLRKQCLEGRFEEVESLKEKWERKGGNGEAKFQSVEAGEYDADTDWDSDDSEDEDEDVDMDEAPQLVEKPKVIPEVDEDGFTKVVSRKKK